MAFNRRQTGAFTWWTVLIGAVAHSDGFPVLQPSEIHRAAGALLVFAAQSWRALLWGWSERWPPVYLQSLELQQ